jgi:23S rRNA pseudouridine1911/1915/1917 synthase
MPARSIALDRGDVGTRVDRVLLRHLRDVPGISRNKIQQLIAGGSVLINSRPAPRTSRRLAAGDALTIDLPEPRPRAVPAPEPLPLEIVFEDDHLLIVNKPAGMVVHPAFRNASGTLFNALLYYARGWPADARPGLLQRLDKHTSGLVIVSKRRSVHVALQRAMNANRVEKDYLAIVIGRPSPAKGTIDLALDRDPWDRRRVMVHDRGQPSVTRYQRLAVSPSEGLSLVQCRLITGRTHQIRVHLAAKGWPILGDAVYGGPDPRLARQALHAWRVAFDHPVTRERVSVSAPLPPEMNALLQPRHPGQHGSER